MSKPVVGEEKKPECIGESGSALKPMEVEVSKGDNDFEDKKFKRYWNIIEQKLKERKETTNSIDYYKELLQ